MRRPPKPYDTPKRRFDILAERNRVLTAALKLIANKLVMDATAAMAMRAIARSALAQVTQSELASAADKPRTPPET